MPTGKLKPGDRIKCEAFGDSVFVVTERISNAIWFRREDGAPFMWSGRKRRGASGQQALLLNAAYQIHYGPWSLLPQLSETDLLETAIAAILEVVRHGHGWDETEEEIRPILRSLIQAAKKL